MRHGSEQSQDIVAAARALYGNAGPRVRFLQSARPLICPFDTLIHWIPESGRMLDVGCGAGLFGGLAGRFRPGISATGFDADAGAIAAAQGMAATHFTDGRISFEQRDVGDAWPEGPFDAVSMIDVLHHIPPPFQKGVIVQAFDHVAPGGVFIYKDMALRPFWRNWWNRLHDIVIARQWINYRPIGEVAVWLTQMGAEIAEQSSKAMGPYGHEWIIARRPA